MIETLRHVARHFDVLDLVAAHRHLVRLEHQNVGAHQHRVHEEAGGDIGIGIIARGIVLVDRRLVGMGAVEHTLACDAGQQPGQLGNLRDVGLAVEHDALRVQPCSQPARRDLQRGALDARRLIAFDQRVIVGQEVETLDAVKPARRHRRPDRADKIAEVGRAGGGDAGKKAGDRGNGCHKKVASQEN